MEGYIIYLKVSVVQDIRKLRDEITKSSLFCFDCICSFKHDDTCEYTLPGSFFSVQKTSDFNRDKGFKSSGVLLKICSQVCY